MKWTFRCGAAAALLGMSAAAQAGVLGGLFSSHSHGDDCCPEPQKPLVARPCEQIYTYQRECSNLRPPCCEEDCCEEQCCEEPACAAPCDAGCNASSCVAGHGKNGCDLFSGLFKGLKKKRGGLCGHGPGCCEAGCAEECGPPMECGDPCEIAKLIYEAQTACYADDREDAVDELGEFDCRCHPEVMTTLLYSLNDCDEGVRSQAADEIGDILNEGRCCCSQEIVAALTCALGDCDRGVRKQAEEALEVCGYEVVEGCCENGCCDGSCTSTGGNVAAPAVPQPAAVSQPAPVPATAAPQAPAPPAPMNKEAAPAPAPPEDPEAYFPSRYRKQTSRQTSLSNLFSMNK